MIWIGRLSVIASIVIVAILVHQIARVRERHPQRLFLIHLGRNATDEDRARARRVVRLNAAACLLGVALGLTARDEALLLLAVCVLPLMPVLWLMKEMLGLVRTLPRAEVPVRYLVPLDEPPSPWSYHSAPMLIAHVAALLLPLALFLRVRARIPASIPMQFDLEGNVRRFGSPDELWILFAIMLFDAALVLGFAWSVAQERRALPERRADEVVQIQFARRAMLVRLVEAMLLAVNVALAVIWMALSLGSLPGRVAWLEVGLPLALAVALVGTIVPFGVFIPGMLRLRDRLREVAGSEVLGTRPSGWRWHGLVYYAPDDPALFVPKQIGIGQTVNLARPGAWLLITALLLLPIVLVIVGVALAR